MKVKLIRESVLWVPWGLSYGHGICDAELSGFFKIPERVNVIDLIVTRRPTKECYKVDVSLNYDGSFIETLRVSLPTDPSQTEECTMDLPTDKYFINRGITSGTYYVRVEY